MMGTPVTMQNIEKAIASMRNGGTTFLEEGVLVNIPKATASGVDETKVPKEKLFGPSGLWLNEAWTSCPWQGPRSKDSTGFVSAYVFFFWKTRVDS